MPSEKVVIEHLSNAGSDHSAQHVLSLLMHSVYHHNLFIAPLLGPIAKVVLSTQQCCNLNKMYRLYRKMYSNVLKSLFFYIICTFFVK